MDYLECLNLQRVLHQRVAAGDSAGEILSVEHPPVLTLGQNADFQFLRFAEAVLSSKGISIFQVERGGEVTAHEPGQLVVYPIIRLRDFGLMPKQYVALLEDSVIALLADFGILARRDAAFPGVWVGQEKVCAVGIRIKDRTSLHGLAINVCNSLKTFDYIVPCGIPGRGVTSLSLLCGRTVTVSEVQELLLIQIQRRLESSWIKLSRSSRYD